jgi:hypothetical protein
MYTGFETHSGDHGEHYFSDVTPFRPVEVYWRFGGTAASVFRIEE